MKKPIICNAHTHLELSTLSQLCPSQPRPFQEWMLDLIAQHHTNRPRREIRRAIEQGIEELLNVGTTFVGDISATWLSVEPLFDSGLEGIVWLEVLGLEPKTALARLHEAQQAIERYRRDPRHGRIQVGLSIHAPYSCAPELFQEGAAWCREADVPLCIHLAESPAEARWLKRGNGLVSFVRQLGITLPPSPGMSPVRYMASLGVLDTRPLLVHMVQVDEEDIRLVSEYGASVVHCPRSNYLLSCGRMPLEAFLAAGVRVYLGTDSRASVPSLDIFEEVQFAEQLHAAYLPPEQIRCLVHQRLPA